jgi:A/G-specific adenine glycosylase
MPQAKLTLSKSFFVSWFKKYGRDFPWRYESIQPFRSMVTEMLLRQTRAEGVAKLWAQFFEEYPDAETLARANREELRKKIAILGFGNQRAEALTHASQHLIKFHEGQVPNTLEERPMRGAARLDRAVRAQTQLPPPDCRRGHHRALPAGSS